MAYSYQRVTIGGVDFDPLTEAEAVAHVRAALARGEGGRIVTPNIDILRQAGAPDVAAILADATLVVADGMPLVWASRLARAPVPERVAGSSLIWSLSAMLAGDARSVYLLGGVPGTDCVQRAAATLVRRHPGLRVAGCASPPYGFENHLAATCAPIIDADPDLVFVGVGFPRQERVISHLRPALPHTWFLGCGAAINFVAGDRRRAPAWMQHTGLEWLHRLGTEPRRLAGRYLLHDAPYALKLLTTSIRRPR